MLLKRLLIITKRDRAILKRRDYVDSSIEDCQGCYATKNVPVSFFLKRCYLDCADICYKYGKYKRYYAEEKDNMKC